VEPGQDILRGRLAQAARLRERLLVLPKGPVHIDEADRGARHSRSGVGDVRCASQVRHALFASTGGDRCMAEVRKRDLVVRVELDRTPKRGIRLLHPPLGRQRLAVVVPSGGVVGSQLGRAAQVLDRVVGIHLETGAPGQNEELHVVGRLAETRPGGREAVLEFSRVKQNAGAVPRFLGGLSHHAATGSPLGHFQSLISAGSSPLSRTWRRSSARRCVNISIASWAPGIVRTANAPDIPRTSSLTAMSARLRASTASVYRSTAFIASRSKGVVVVPSSAYPRTWKRSWEGRRWIS